jgi:ferrochelatase
MTVGVLVMAHGTPANTEEIEAFYTRIRRGRPPEPAQLAELTARYDAIGGTSPLAARTAAQVTGIAARLDQARPGRFDVRYGGTSPLAARTRAQVDALRDVLDLRVPGRYRVSFGAKHTEPVLEDAAAALAASGVDAVIGLVLTPHASSLGSGEYLERARDALGDTPFTAIAEWYDNPSFVRLMAQRVRAALADVTGRARVLFTAHSLPERVRAAGDPYPDQLEESARLVATEAGLADWSVAWQSAGRTPEPWLGPDIRDEVRRLAAEGETDAVVVCPIGFVADHLEVLYDLDIELAAVAASVGLAYARTSSLNDDPAFIAALADVVTAADQTA